MKGYVLKFFIPILCSVSVNQFNKKIKLALSESINTYPFLFKLDVDKDIEILLCPVNSTFKDRFFKTVRLNTYIQDKSFVIFFKDQLVKSRICSTTSLSNTFN